MSILLEKNHQSPPFRRISFNNERDTLVCTTENGYSLINCCPIIPVVSKNLCQYGFHSVDIYKRSNIIAFTGTEKTVKYNSNTLYIFDDSSDSEIARIVFDETIVSCHIKWDFIIVLLHEYTHIYNLGDLSLYAKYNTYSNPKGLCDLQMMDGEPIIATLGKYKGTIRLSCGKREEKIIRAHESAIGCLCLSREGNLLASASVRGSVIRVFETQTKKCVSTIRRGHMYAVIVNLEFDRHTQYLLCNSDSTIHIAKRNTSYSTRGTGETPDSDNRNENMFFNSFHIRYSNPDRSKSMLAVFGSEPESVYIITSKGSFQKGSLDGDRSLVVFQNIQLTDCHLYPFCSIKRHAFHLTISE